jgi:hypothetical protein
MTKQTKFEEDLKAFFPKIYKLHLLGKWDKYLWEVIYELEKIADENAFAEVKIIYQMGRINNIYVTRKLTTKPLDKQGYAFGGQSNDRGLTAEKEIEKEKPEV